MTTSNALTLPEVAARLHVPVSTARKLCVRGVLRGFKVGHSWRVVPSDLDAYIDHQRAVQAQRHDAHRQGAPSRALQALPGWKTFQ